MGDKIDYSYRILEKFLRLKDFSSKEEALEIAQRMIKVVSDKQKYSDKVREQYDEAYKKLNSLTYAEMKEIIALLIKEEDDDEEED